jgi:hypothetical protein
MDAIQAAKLLSIPTAFFLGSYNFTFSQNVMPHFYSASPSVIAPAFDKIYHRGGATILPIATIAIAANAYLAFESGSSKRLLYGTAAALVAATLPLTQVVMMPTISRLIEIGRNTGLQQKGGIEAEVVSLLKTWVAQNYFRSSLHLTAGALSLYAALS